MRRALALLVVLAACGGSGGSDAALPDGTHVGTVVELDPTEFVLTVDVRDDGDGTTQLTLDEDLRVRLLQPDGGLRTVSFADWRAGFEPDDRSYYGTSRSTYELTIEDGRVVAIDEVAST